MTWWRLLYEISLRTGDGAPEQKFSKRQTERRPEEVGLIQAFVGPVKECFNHRLSKQVAQPFGFHGRADFPVFGFANCKDIPSRTKEHGISNVVFLLLGLRCCRVAFIAGRIYGTKFDLAVG